MELKGGMFRHGRVAESTGDKMNHCQVAIQLAKHVLLVKGFIVSEIV